MHLRRALQIDYFTSSINNNKTDLIMTNGTVKWFNPTKGYGFIAPDDGSSDIFVHISAVEKAGLSSLNEGQRLSYEVTTHKDRTSATNLMVAE